VFPISLLARERETTHDIVVDRMFIVWDCFVSEAGLFHVCVVKELDATDPAEARTTIAHLENQSRHPSYHPQGPRALFGALRSVEQSLGARVGMRSSRKGREGWGCDEELRG
jgi:hypothetical protein